MYGYSGMYGFFFGKLFTTENVCAIIISTPTTTEQEVPEMTKTTRELSIILTDIRRNESYDYYLGSVGMLQLMGYDYELYFEDEDDISSMAVRVLKAE